VASFFCLVVSEASGSSSTLAAGGVSLSTVGSVSLLATGVTRLAPRNSNGVARYSGRVTPPC
jgi:hypothetical protein